jgi:solute carrier family 25 carnitine/acylcarnitine transporter 20/29
MFLAGVLGGLASFAVSAPTELLKVRAQAAPATPPGTPTTNTEAGRRSGSSRQGGSSGAGSTWAQARALLRAEGPRGFFLGGGVTAVRDAVGYGFYFVAYEAMRRELFGAAATPADRNHGGGPADGGAPAPPELAAWKILACGGVAGVISWAVVFPLDVVKTRVQAQPVLGLSPSRPIGPAPVRGAVVVVGEHAPLLQPSPPLSPKHAKAVVTATVQRVRPASSSSSSSATSVSAPASPTTETARRTVQAARQSTWAITQAAYREGGLAVFFRGLGVCSVRAFVVNAVQWAVYEWIVGLLVAARR